MPSRIKQHTNLSNIDRMKEQLRLLSMPAFGSIAIPVAGMPASNPSLFPGFAVSGRELPPPRCLPVLAGCKALHISGTPTRTTTSAAVSFYRTTSGKQNGGNTAIAGFTRLHRTK